MEKVKSLRLCSTFLVILWMVVVFLFSSQNGESSFNTSGIVIDKLDNIISIESEKNELPQSSDELKPKSSYKYSNNIQKVVRKNAHYILYLVGGVFLSIFFYTFFGFNTKSVIYTILSGILYAISDEIHQIFVQGRTSSIIDVGIDTLGIITGTILFVIFIKIFKLSTFSIKKIGGEVMALPKEERDFEYLSIEHPMNLASNNVIKFEKDDSKELVKHKKSISETAYSFFKRTVDITASSIALTILSPVFLFTTLAIRKDSAGPAVFTQQRIGKNGKLFNIYKFRTMVPDADKKLFELLENDEQAREEYKVNKKLKNDPRITKVGSFLRKTSIDELPQLINVLKGDMSLVGPRPYLPREKEDMGEYYNTIVESKPGITGLWQVSGRSNTTFEERMKFDIEYNQNKSFTNDMGLLFKTVSVVINKDGAE